jgi:uncharacterized protein
MPASRAFLTAQWRYLLMLNYEVDPAVLAPLLPAGVELDSWNGKTLVSMVGFLFLHTRVLGASVPFHQNFEEVNLRFYVRREAGGELRRGVVFVKELVPKPWIARIARWVYHENYVALPMGHTIERDRQGSLCPEALVEYTWKHRRRRHRLGGMVIGDPALPQPGSEEEFISEHYWGYTRLGQRKTGEYQVEHPAWRVWPVAQPYLLCDIQALYGAPFEPFLHKPPRSAFLAEGSQVQVKIGKAFQVSPAVGCQ